MMVNSASTPGDSGNASYWDQNIDKWSDLYLDISHGGETFSSPPVVTYFYNKTIRRYEAHLMKERYRQTMAFIEKHARPGVTLTDVGCGVGLFSVEAARRGASVNAVDFSQAALDATKRNVQKNVPNAGDRVTYTRLDAARDPWPRSDVAFTVGVTPYIDDIEGFYRNAVNSTQLFYCHLVDASHWANRLRKVVPLLNVRNLRFYHRREIDAILARHGWKLLSRQPFATGFIDLCAPSTAKDAR